MTSDTSLHVDLVLTLQNSVCLLSQVILHYDLHENTHNLSLLIHPLQNRFLHHISHLVFTTASLLSSDAQTAFLSGNLFSEVIMPTPVPAHIRQPEYYTADIS